MSFSTMVVHVDVEHDSDQRVELAIDLADRFQAALVGIAGCALWPAFMAGDVGLTESNEYDLQKVKARFEQRGKTFRAQGRSLKRVEWRSALEPPGELLLREARVADLLIVGRRRSGDGADPGIIVLRPAGPFCWCPTPSLRCRFAGWSSLGRIRVNAVAPVRDALPFLQQAKEVLLVGMGEHESQSDGKKDLADVTAYLVRHQVIVAAEVWQRPQRPVAAELLHIVEEEKADLIVAGGYGHSRLGEWIFGGVTRELLTASPVCCLLSH